MHLVKIRLDFNPFHIKFLAQKELRKKTAVFMLFVYFHRNIISISEKMSLEDAAFEKLCIRTQLVNLLIN